MNELRVVKLSSFQVLFTSVVYEAVCFVFSRASLCEKCCFLATLDLPFLSPPGSCYASTKRSYFVFYVISSNFHLTALKRYLNNSQETFASRCDLYLHSCRR